MLGSFPYMIITARSRWLGMSTGRFLFQGVELFRAYLYSELAALDCHEFLYSHSLQPAGLATWSIAN